MEQHNYKEWLEVSKNEYRGYIDQLKTDKVYSEKQTFENGTEALDIISYKTGKVLCGIIQPPEEEAKYYVFEMPDNDERKPAPAKRQVVLETKEEVQAFLELLNKLKEGKVDD